MKALINNSMLSKLKAEDTPYDVWDKKLAGFHIRVYPSGKKVFRCAYTRGKVCTLGKVGLLTTIQARDKALHILGEAAIGIHPNSKKNLESNEKLTFAKYIETEYGPWRETNRKCGKEDIARLITHFIEIFGDKLLTEIQPLVLEKWRSKRLKSGISPATINRDINNLKASLAKAKEWRFISENPLVNFKPTQIDKAAKIRYLDQDEYQRLLSVVNTYKRSDYMKPLIVLSLNTGLRRGELFQLTWKNVDFTNKLLTVEGGISKTGNTRHVPLNSYALEILEEWHNHGSSNELVFYQNDGKALTTVQRQWEAISKLARIDNFRWHDMRHHFASRLVMASVDLNTVRELLGHSDIKMTLRYAHLAPEHKAQAVAKLMSNTY